MNLCRIQLKDLLWNLPGVLTCGDGCITIKRQTLMVTTTLLDALSRYESPKMLQKTKMCIISVLKKIVLLIESFKNDESFSSSFKTHLNEHIESYFTNYVHHCDLLNVIEILRHIYQLSDKTYI